MINEIDAGDARQQQRSDALMGALIVAGDKPPLHCLITNISSEGAELKPVSEVRVPQHFVLQVPHQERAYRAEVRWREDGRIGVTFHGSEHRARPMPQPVAR